jgi:hypothetical protein
MYIYRERERERDSHSKLGMLWMQLSRTACILLIGRFTTYAANF